MAAVITNTDNNQQWNIKNATLVPLTLGDLVGVPTILPGQSIDLLRYVSTEVIEQSTAIQVALADGSLVVQKSQNHPDLLDVEFNNGSSGSSVEINWNNGPAQFVTLSGDVGSNVTIRLTNPHTGSFLLRVKQDVNGSHTLTWPSNVKWEGGSALVPTSTAAAISIYSMYYSNLDSNYYITALLDLK